MKYPYKVLENKIDEAGTELYDQSKKMDVTQILQYCDWGLKVVNGFVVAVEKYFSADYISERMGNKIATIRRNHKTLTRIKSELQQYLNSQENYQI